MIACRKVCSTTISGAGCVPGTSCLAVCGLCDGIAAIGQFCIDTRLALALKGDVKKGLFFRGSESLPLGTAIRPVAELIDYLLTGRMPLFSL
jgi:nitronate monooxygenase